MFYQSTNVVSNLNLKDNYDSFNNDEINCPEHKLPRKYWVPELKKFFCEHDYINSNEMLHFKFILDKYSEDIKNLKQLSNQKTRSNCEELYSKSNISNIHFEKLFEIINNFNESFKEFGMNFINKFIETSEQDKEIFKLRDLIDSIKFNEQGKADYIGIGNDAEREKNYLRLAKILISRNFNNTKNNGEPFDFYGKLIFFMNELINFLILITKNSSELIEFSYCNLLQEICQVENKTYDPKFMSVKSPILLREEISNIIDMLNFQMNANNNLNAKNSVLENELSTKILIFEESIKKLNNEIVELRNSKYKIEIEKNDLQLKLNALNNQIQIIQSTNNSYQYTIEKNNQIISDLNSQIKLLKENEQNLNLVSSSNDHEKNHIREIYESKINEMNIIIQNYLNTINNLNAEITNLKVKEEEIKKILDFQTAENLRIKIDNDKKLKDLQDFNNSNQIIINNLNFEISRLKQADQEKLLLSQNSQLEEINKIKLEYDMKINDQEVKLSILENTLEKEKIHSQLKKNEFLNEIESYRKIISDLNNQIRLSNEKIESHQTLEESYKTEKRHLDMYISEIDSYKIELQSQIKQNEILNTRVEELERTLNLSKEKSEQISFILNQHTDFKIKFDDLLIQKELLEKELIEKNNKIIQIQLQIESLSFQNHTFNAEIISLREQIKLSNNMQNTFKIFQCQLEDANNSISKLEIENTELKNKLSKLSVELDQSKYKSNEYNVLIEKQNEEINQLRNYERKLDILTNSKMEIEKLKDRFDYQEKFISQSSSNVLFSGQKLKANSLDFDVSQLKDRNSSLSDSLSIVSGGNTKLSVSFNNALLTQNHWSKITDWFSTLNISNSNNISINLLMKASQDGFSANVFKNKCHKKTNTLVLVLTSFDKLIGGFTPIPWNTDDYVYVSDPNKKTFLFSLTNGKKYHLTNITYAVCHGSEIGPVFGGGSDLEIVSNCNRKYNNFSGIGHSFDSDETSESFYGGSKYLVKDYEVYEVKF